MPGFREFSDIIIETFKSVGGPNVLCADTTIGADSMPAQGMAAAAENMFNIKCNGDRNGKIYYTQNYHQASYIKNNGELKLIKDSGGTYTPRYKLNTAGGCGTDCSGLASWICMESGLFKRDVIFTSTIAGDSKEPKKFKEFNSLKDALIDGYTLTEVDINYRQKGDLLCSTIGNAISPILKKPAGRTDGITSTGHCAICYNANTVVGIGGTRGTSTKASFSPNTYKICYRVVKI